MMAILFILCAIVLSLFNGLFGLDLESTHIVVLSILISIGIVLEDVYKKLNNRKDM